jgi:polyhydroxyalkanoate synthesis regulator phasin
MGQLGIIDRLKTRATRAVEGIVTSEKGAAAITGAMRRMQDGRRALDEKATEVISALGLATKADAERVSRRIGKLRKRLQALLDEVEQS